MSISPLNLFRHELIGLETQVVKSRDPTHVSRCGKIVGESKEMIQISTEEGEILLPKEVCVFSIKLPDGELVQIDGGLLRGRPEDRMKKRISRRW